MPNHVHYRYIKAALVLLILLFCGYSYNFYRNLFSPASEYLQFDFYLPQVSENCYYQAKSRYSFILPNCSNYQPGHHYHVKARLPRKTDNEFDYYKKIDILEFNLIEANRIFAFFHLDTLRANLAVLRLRWQHKIIEVFAEYFSFDGAYLATSLVLGSKVKPLPPVLRDEFIILGLSHLVTVSGFHLHLLMLFISGGASDFLPLKLKFFALLFWGCFYSWLVGNPPSLLRALLMLIFTLICRTFLFKYPTSFYLLFQTVIWLVFTQENYLINIGFLLSISATFGVLLACRWWSWRDLSKGDIVPFPQLIAGKIYPLWLVKIYLGIKRVLFVSLVVQLITLPVQIFFFQLINPAGFILSALFSWLLAPLILMCFTIAILSLMVSDYFYLRQWLLAPLSLVAKVLLDWVLQYVHQVSALFSPLVMRNLVVFWPYWLIYYLLIFCLFYYWRQHYLGQKKIYEIF